MTPSTITIPRPAPGITPHAFWDEWLPPVLDDFAAVIHEHAGPLKATLAVRVTGEGGGEWSVKVAEGKVDIVPRLVSPATVTLTLNAQDFSDAVCGKNDNLLPWSGGLSGEMDPAKIGETIRNAAATLEQIKGAMLFRAEDPAGSFVVLLNFQGKYRDQPDTTVSINKTDLLDMKLSGINMVQMFITGKIRVDGLLDLVMKFAPLVTGW